MRTFLRTFPCSVTASRNKLFFRAYEHAVLAAGTDFRSDRLWEMYINWEDEQGNLREVTSIYDRILGIPTQLYSHHFQR